VHPAPEIGASAPSGEGEESRWRPCCLGAGIDALLTGLAERFVDEPGKGLGLFGAFASALVGYEGRLGHGEWLVGQPEMDEETDEDESYHEALVKQLIRRPDEILFHGDERGPLYCIRSILNYPLHSYTRPRHGERISTSFVESTVNQVVSKRMVKKQQMRWSKRGAHLLLQIRTRVLNGEWEETFRTWYPGFRAHTMPRAA
jgi:hypothetical protein